ncbi:MAG: transporter substrate-binding domain-containing protein [Deltaproteobacteria bacterium]|nr:MAG: transporter substrate-binding domain-containing protein [Deltaproteobacteria bacterium]
MMKRARVTLVLVLVLAFLSACAHTTETSVQTETAAAPSLQRILQKGELVVGTAASMPPLNMTTKEGEIIGLEADLANHMARAMGVKLRLEAMEFSKLLSALEQGRVDMVISGMTITPTRNLKVAFIGPYFISGKAFLTKLATIAAVEETTEINSPSVRLTALRGSTSQYFVEEVLAKVQFVPAKDYDEAVQMVIQDKVHAFVADYPICVVSVFRYPNQGLLSVITPLTYEPLGIAVPADDPHLINWVENFLNTVEGSGEMEELKDRWFGDGSWLFRLP